MVTPYTYNAKVVGVHDGDSITLDIDLGFGVVLKNRKMRLMFIDAPETVGENKEAGFVSKAALEKKILNKNVVIVTDKDRHEMYGRYLVTIYLPEMILEEKNSTSAGYMNVNKWMVDNNFAIRFGNKWFND